MGIDTTAFAVMGVFVKSNLLFEKTNKRKVPSCPHRAVERAGKFCANCGIKVAMVEEEEDSVVNDDLWEHLCNTAIEVQGDNGAKGYLFGLSLSADEWAENVETMPLPTKEEVVKAVQEQLADLPHPVKYVFDENEIKIHLYMDHR